MSARVRAREAAVWTTLAAKERLCEELDDLARIERRHGGRRAIAIRAGPWAALPPLPDKWEKKLVARRDAALRALSDPAATGDYLARIERGIESRRERLLELELSLGLDSPAELQKQRLALQVKQLRERFKNAAPAESETPAERLVAWCAEPGVADAADRQRCEKIFAKLSSKTE